MLFLSVVLALLLEHLRPLPWHRVLERRQRRWAAWVVRRVDTGRGVHAGLGWALAALGPGVLVALVYGALGRGLGWPLAWLWSVLVLHLSLGLSRLADQGAQLRAAWEHGDRARMRHVLARWQQRPSQPWPPDELARQGLQQAVLAAHRQVFGVLFWYVLLAAWGCGPAGALVYRQGEWLARHWLSGGPRAIGPRAVGVSPAMARRAARGWQWLDAVPARLTALGWALVGRFQPALLSWRAQAERFALRSDGVVLASASGALGVALAGAQPGWAEMPGEAAQPEHLQAVLVLVWRLLGVWLLVLALLALARLI